MNISEYELKNIGFKANVDFCVAHGDWRKATITKFYNYKDKIFGLIILDNGQKVGVLDLEKLVGNGRIKVNNCKESLSEYIKNLQNKNKNPIYKTVKPQAPKICYDDINEITNYLDSRNVTSFFHFSPICNLDSILQNGICSRDYCDSCGIKYQHTDVTRYDNLNEFISLSISFPNYKMRYMKEQELNQRFVIIEIDPAIIKKFGISERLFCDMNASISKNKRNDKTIGPNLKHLKSMFYSENIIRKIRELPSHYTTDPQAEVLVKGPIPIEYFKKIHFDNNKDFTHYFEKYHSPLFVEDRSYFTYRKDFAYHQTYAKIMKEDNNKWQEDLPF